MLSGPPPRARDMDDRPTAPRAVPSRYEREITAAGEDSLSRIARRISPGEVVLDLGTGPGALGRWLSARGCIVDGVERDPSDAASARSHYRTLHQLDLEIDDLVAVAGETRYDAVVAADVLEHLRDPGRILDAAVRLLRPHGRILVSVPNVAYAGLIATIVRGDFPYGPLGLLDDTHLRFFTRRSLVRFLSEHGLGVTAVEVVSRPLHQSEFRDEHVDELPPALATAILTLPDALTYQLVAEAAPGVASAPDVAEAAAAHLTFGVKAYWRAEGEAFGEDRSAVASGEIGRADQTIALPVPALSRTPVELRLDVADRRGFLRVHGIRLRTAAGAIRWAWAGDALSLGAAPSHAGLTELSVDGDRWWLSSEVDPWLVLPIPADALSVAGGGAIEIDLDWPVSPDAFALTRAVVARDRAWAAARAAFGVRISALEGQIGALEGEIAALARDVSDRDRRLAEAAAAAAAKEQALWAEIVRLERWTRRPLRAIRRGLAPRAFVLTTTPRAQASLAPGGWESVGPAPRFALAHGTNRFPGGWVEVDLACDVEDDRPVVPRLLARSATSSAEIQVVLPPVAQGRSQGVVKLPEHISELSLVPVDRPARFRLGPLHVRELPRALAAAKLVAPHVGGQGKNPARALAAMREALGVYRARGWSGLKRHLRDATAPRLVAPTRKLAKVAGPRVAVLTLRLSKGYGVDVVVARQIEYLCARGYDVTAIVVEADGHHDASLAPYVESGQLRVISIGSPEEAAREVVRQGAVIAIAETPPFFDALSLVPDSVVRVMFDHGEPPAELFADAEVRRGIAARKVEISRSVDLSIAISRFIQRDSGLHDAQVCFNGNDHLLRRRANLAHLVGKFRRWHGLGDAFVVLNVTRFLADERRYKGAEDYAAVREALARLRPDLATRVRFVLAGRSEEADRAWAAAAGLVAVSNPSDDELVAGYLDSDLYLTTSRWEGCNLGLAQALSLGVPALASARGAHPEFPIRTSDDPETLARWVIEQVDRASGEVRLPLQRLRRATVYPWRDAAHRLEGLVADAVARRAPARPELPPPLVLAREEAAPELSILILSKDRPDLIVPCLKSIEERVDVPYEVLVGDTGTTDAETLRFYETTRHQIHYLGHYNFSGGNNVLAARARGRYLLFLNNDTALIQSSFRAAIDFLAAHPRVGCLGGYLLYADRTLQHAGVRICTRPPPYHGIPEHLDRLRPYDTYPGRAAPREVVAVTGAMMLVETATFARAGGFDEVYIEEAQDIDLCLRLRREGRASIVHPALAAYHYENSTRTVKESPIDRAEFLRRFGALIEGELLEWQDRNGLAEPREGT